MHLFSAATNSEQHSGIFCARDVDRAEGERTRKVHIYLKTKQTKPHHEFASKNYEQEEE